MVPPIALQRLAHTCNDGRMSNLTEDGTVPVWDLADRMRKALRDSGVSVQEMADYLDVSRTTISNWINGRRPPPVAALRLWAMQTGVDYEWLSGDEDPKSGGASPTTRRRIRKPGRLPRLHGLAAAAGMAAFALSGMGAA